eukprot:EG_transcript_11986
MYVWPPLLPAVLLLLLSPGGRPFLNHVVPDRCAHYSQHQQDELLRKWFFHDLQGGVFVEIGALDGVFLSNSLHFELCLNWTGVLIEGNRRNFVALQRNLKHRPHSRAIHMAVCPPPMTKVNFTVAGDQVAGSLLGMAPSFIQGWHHNNATYEEVPCAPMKALLAGMQHVDYWSLDIEGAELIAIETVDFAAVQFDVIVVELDGHDPAKNHKVRLILRDNDFIECRWGSLRGDNAVFVSRRSPYNCKPLGDQPCLCSYDDCNCDGIKRHWVHKKLSNGRRSWMYLPEGK